MSVARILARYALGVAAAAVACVSTRPVTRLPVDEATKQV